MKKLLLSLLLLLSLAAFAAPADYKVYYVKGVVKKGLQVLRRGDSLSVQDAVQLSAGAELYLLCRDYNLVQLKKAGSYKLRDVAACPTKNTSLTASYFRYVWDELRSHHGDPEKNPRHYMRNKGAVTRAGCNDPKFRSALFVDTIISSGGNLPLYWKAAADTSWLTVYAAPNGGAPLHTTVLAKGAPLGLIDLQAATPESNELYWFVGPADGGDCARKYLLLLPAPEYQLRVQALLQQVVPTTPFETALMKGFLLEENHYLQEALLYYGEAFRLQPNNPRAKAA
ncbi:MAG: hypothetical protein EOO16_19895, partial [Chitinophagaceae bacterium]